MMFSEPARSTRYSLPTRMYSSPSGVTSRTLTVTMNTAARQPGSDQDRGERGQEKLSCMPGRPPP